MIKRVTTNFIYTRAHATALQSWLIKVEFSTSRNEYMRFDCSIERMNLAGDFGTTASHMSHMRDEPARNNCWLLGAQAAIFSACLHAALICA